MKKGLGKIEGVERRKGRNRSDKVLEVKKGVEKILEVKR